LRRGRRHGLQRDPPDRGRAATRPLGARRGLDAPRLVLRRRGDLEAAADRDRRPPRLHRPHRPDPRRRPGAVGQRGRRRRDGDAASARALRRRERGAAARVRAERRLLRRDRTVGLPAQAAVRDASPGGAVRGPAVGRRRGPLHRARDPRRPRAAHLPGGVALHGRPRPGARLRHQSELGGRARAARRRRSRRRPVEPPAVGVRLRRVRPRAGHKPRHRHPVRARRCHLHRAREHAEARRRGRGARPVSVAPVELRGLRKTYGELIAVDDVTLTVRPGDIFGYLGPNGAGKTTSLRMMLGLIAPTAGNVRLFGEDPIADPVAALADVAGFVEEPAFYPYLTGRRNLEMLAALDGGDGERIDEVLRLVELDGRAGDRVRGYSHGMRQRLGLAAALMRSPKLLLLDEPTTGLDPAGMRDMRDMVRRLAGEGITIVLSTHLMSEVEQLCNRLAIIQLGRIRYEGELADLVARSDGRYRLDATDPARAAEICRAIPGIRDVAAEDGSVWFAADADAAASVSVRLAQDGIGVRALVPGGRSLEERFFEITEGAG